MAGIKIYCVGGTIDKVYFDANSEYQVGEPQVEAIFQMAGVSFDYEICSLMRKDSLEMTDRDRAALREMIDQDMHRRILITHGTDTMVDTAQSLSSIRGKTIVLTGAMTPARFRDTDAPFNIGFATGALEVLPAGVYICMNGQVFPADNVRKNRDQRRFEFVNPPAG